MSAKIRRVKKRGSAAREKRREGEKERKKKEKGGEWFRGGGRERIPRNQKNGEKRGTTHVDQHEKDETRESDTVLGRNDGADDGAEKTQLRRVKMFARDGTAR